ncbi:unnamed protein product [Caretta caretta]
MDSNSSTSDVITTKIALKIEHLLDDLILQLKACRQTLALVQIYLQDWNRPGPSLEFLLLKVNQSTQVCIFGNSGHIKTEETWQAWCICELRAKLCQRDLERKSLRYNGLCGDCIASIMSHKSLSHTEMKGIN